MAKQPQPDNRLHILGIRHHGPGSARAMLAALDAADPAIVLIEGPADADAIIPFAASPDMVPPLALLVHATEDASNASFYPFAVYSPEWQAMRWALARGRPVRFIDLPAEHRLALMAEARKAAEAALARLAAEAEAGAVEGGGDDRDRPEGDGGDAQDAGNEPVGTCRRAGDTDVPADDTASPDAASPDSATLDSAALAIRRDPLAYLAQIAGYDDSEAWWNALIEQGAHGPEVFAAIETAMGELRGYVESELHKLAPSGSSPEAATALAADPDRPLEIQREAHMRLAIAAAMKETEGAVAVVCGAWHAPALRRKVAQADDKAALKGLLRLKITATWVPWTNTRLASSSGYGAGVTSPGWYAHLWEEFERADGVPSPRQFTARWQGRIARLLRDNGRPASTASVIEGVRLAETLAALRDLSMPGLDEMREATLATLCSGESAPWKLVETELVVGRAVGEIDDNVPQMPLAADLARLQKKLKLKPEALDREVPLDLRSDAGLQKSLLLHRLDLIGVTWGVLLGAGSSRGTFRENWRLRWEPEFSVKLAEALIYGTTIEQAAGNCAVAKARATQSLPAMAEAVNGCLLAGLDDAARVTISILQARATASSDIGGLAGTIPPLASVLRYGTAREIPADELRLLVVSLAEAVCAGLVYGCRNLQAEEAAGLRASLAGLDQALAVLDIAAVSEAWQSALARVADDEQAHGSLRGFAVRRLYDQGHLPLPETALYLSRALSRSVPPLEAGAWLDGFLGASGQLLVYDADLRSIIDGWIVAIGEDDFVALLPMLRRATSAIDRMERRKLIEEIVRSPLPSAAPAGGGNPATAAAIAESAGSNAPGFAAALPLIVRILGLRPIEQGSSP